MTFASKGRKNYVDVVGRCLCGMHQATFLNTLSLSFIVSLSHTHSHTHRISHSTSLYVPLYCLSHTRNTVYKTRSSFCFFDFVIPDSGLIDLILNYMHSSRCSSDSVVTGLWSNGKILFWFPAGTRDDPFLNCHHSFL